MIEVSRLSAGYADRTVLEQLSFTIQPGEWVTIIGRNGSGKSTLLRTMAGLLPLGQGDIRLQGKLLTDYGRKELARTVSVLPQSRDVPAISVEGLVSHGRFPYLGLSRKLTAQDKEKIADALSCTGAQEYRDRQLQELSGGERQKAYLAMTIAQDTPILFLDEPTTYLDIAMQFELLTLIDRLHKQGKTIVMVLHDLQQALAVSGRLLLLEQGRLVQFAPPEEMIESGALERCFSIRIEQLQSPDGQTHYYFLPKNR